MDDLISRQAAIDALNGNITVTGEENAKAVQKYIRSVSLKIHDLPSAQPERKKGRWIDMDDHVMCSCCGATHYGSDKNFCPNCGCYMSKP